MVIQGVIINCYPGTTEIPEPPWCPDCGPVWGIHPKEGVESIIPDGLMQVCDVHQAWLDACEEKTSSGLKTYNLNKHPYPQVPRKPAAWKIT